MSDPHQPQAPGQYPPPNQQGWGQQQPYQQQPSYGQGYGQGGYASHAAPAKPKKPVPWLPVAVGALALAGYDGLSGFITTITYRVGSEYGGWNFESVIYLFASLVTLVAAVLAVVALLGGNRGLQLAAAGVTAFAALLQFVAVFTRLVNWLGSSNDLGGNYAAGGFLSILFGFGSVLIIGGIAAVLFLKKD